MTLIVYDGKTLAVDGMMTSSNTIVSSETNKIKVADNIVFAGAGSWVNVNMVWQWLLHGGDKPELKESFAGLMFTARGTYSLDDYLYPTRVPGDELIAVGAGTAAAIAFLSLGIDSKEVVERVSELNPFIGGRVRTLKNPCMTREEEYDFNKIGVKL